MKIKGSHIEIPKDNIFKEDLLNRKTNLEILTDLINSIDEPFVLCIDSPWGSGKTTFIKMWQQYLTNNGFPTLYFNSWENDFSDDALISFMGEIEAGLNELLISPKKSKKIHEAFEVTKNIGKKLIKKSIPLLLKIGTSGILDIEKETEKAISDAMEKYASEKIKEYEIKKNTIQEFKKHLKSFIDQIANQNDSFKPLIVFIDELDRCRPLFAIELLEKVKHIFAVAGIIFVLGIDKIQLSHSVRSIYGLNMEVDGYLKRFIDITFKLPRANMQEFIITLLNKFGIIEYLNRFKKNNYEIIDSYLFIHLFEIVNKFHFSLRETEQFISHLNIVLRTYIENPWRELELIYFLMVVRFKNSALYNQIKNDDFELKNLLRYIEEFPERTFSWGTLKEKIEAQILSSLRQEEKYKEGVTRKVEKYRKNVEESKEDVSGVNLREKCVLHLWYESNSNMNLDFHKVFNKIEIAERFQS